MNYTERRRVFIGSSSEGESIAETVRSILSPAFDVVVWVDKEEVFRVNSSFLHDLHLGSLKFDFAVFIGTADDVVTHRETDGIQPRDNIIFEFGLFMGRLGIDRSFLLLEEGARAMSDLSGISIDRFDKSDSSTIKNAATALKNRLLTTPDGSINFFPSLALVGIYFENFIKPVCTYLMRSPQVEYIGLKCPHDGIHVYVPNELSQNVNLQSERFKRRENMDLSDHSFDSDGRPRKVYMQLETDRSVVRVIDFPTVLFGLRWTIDQLLAQDARDETGDYHLVLNRELGKFCAKLQKDCDREFPGMVHIHRYSERGQSAVPLSK